MNQLPTWKRATLLKLLVEGVSMNAAMRMVGVSPTAINKLLVDAGNACQEWHELEVRDVKAGRVQCDEIWSFVYAKDKNLPLFWGRNEHAGSTWTFLALDVRSRFVLAWLTAPRGYNGAYELMADLRSRIVSCESISTDGLASYKPAVEDTFGRSVNFGMLVKDNHLEKREVFGKHSGGR